MPNVRELTETLRICKQAISNDFKAMGMVEKQENWVPYELQLRVVERRFFPCEQLLLQRQNRKTLWRSMGFLPHSPYSPDIAPSNYHLFRDGIGDGCLEQCKNLEILMIEECFNNKVFINSKPKLIYIIIQKRINTRIMELINSSGTKTEYKNPAAGSIIDHTITRKGMFDFFLVPQNVQMGTVSPSHYIVLHDSSSMKPDHIQRLSFKMCHLYYNWPGTIRVPACCQYAHKLAFLIGQHVKSKPSRLLEDTLFYL